MGDSSIVRRPRRADLAPRSGTRPLVADALPILHHQAVLLALVAKHPARAKAGPAEAQPHASRARLGIAVPLVLALPFMPIEMMPPQGALFAFHDQNPGTGGLSVQPCCRATVWACVRV